MEFAVIDEEKAVEVYVQAKERFASGKVSRCVGDEDEAPKVEAVMGISLARRFEQNIRNARECFAPETYNLPPDTTERELRELITLLKRPDAKKVRIDLSEKQALWNQLVADHWGTEPTETEKQPWYERIFNWLKNWFTKK